MDDAPTDDGLLVTALVAAAAHGDQSAWNMLIRRYTPLVMSVVRRYRLGAQDTEDVRQTLWLRLVEHLADIREPRALPQWLVTTARNECLRVLKAAQRTQPVDPLGDLELVDEASTADLGEGLLRSERHQALLEAFAALSDHHRELLSLLLADPAVPYAEISSRLQIPIGSIGPTRARALQKLREAPSIAAFREQGRTEGGECYDVAAVGRR
jgi:RNA polymerase sigma factor (sigma-70 family)